MNYLGPKEYLVVDVKQGKGIFSVKEKENKTNNKNNTWKRKTCPGQNLVNLPNKEKEYLICNNNYERILIGQNILMKKKDLKIKYCNRPNLSI
jgi:hypothetical protein